MSYLKYYNEKIHNIVKLIFHGSLEEHITSHYQCKSCKINKFCGLSSKHIDWHGNTFENFCLQFYIHFIIPRKNMDNPVYTVLLLLILLCKVNLIECVFWTNLILLIYFIVDRLLWSTGRVFGILINCII